MSAKMNYPSDIKPLTSLRFFAAFWLLLFFFWSRIDGVPRPLIIENGNLGVDLFFILSGFVLAHVYGPQVSNGQYLHKSFLWARIARVYPTHIVTFLMMFAMFLVAIIRGSEFDQNAFNVSHIPYHLTLTQAWGYIGGDTWNFPSWSISAEWFAYLTFPATFWLASKFKNSPIAGLFLVFAVFYGFYALTKGINVELTNMTWQGGVVRILPSFLGGIMLWFIGNNGIFNPKYARIALIINVLLLAIICSTMNAPYIVWPLLLGVVFFLAETTKTPNQEILGTKLFVYLGEISFSMYMVHLPVDIVTCRIIKKLAGGLHLETQGAICLVIGIIMTMIVAAISHALIEKPARDYLRKKVQFKHKPAKKDKIDYSAIGITKN